MKGCWSGLFRKIPAFIPLIYRNRVITRIPEVSRKLYFTFDDGPHPEVTPRVLDILEKYHTKATFFVLGKNVEKYPDIFQKIKHQGHSTGNHTYSHLNGWKTPDEEYYHDIELCNQLVPTPIFRPPYGRLKLRQAHYLSTQYQIILWTLLSLDFIENLNPEDVLKKLMNESFRGGEIIVFHDSVKASPRLLYALPRFVEFILEKGFTFEPLSREL